MRFPGGVFDSGSRILFPVLAAMASALAAPAELMPFLQAELKRNFAELRRKDSLPPYFAAYRVHDSDFHAFSANRGGVLLDRREQARAMGVEMRVGSPAFDNTHPLRENLEFPGWSGFQNLPWPREENAAYWRKSLRMATDYAFRSARDRYAKIRANVEVRPAEGDTGMDFAPAKPVRSLKAKPRPLPARKELDSLYARMLRASELFSAPFVYGSSIDFRYGTVLKRLVNTEGTALVQEEALGRLSAYAETKAPDGAILWLARDFHFREAPLDFPEDTLTAALAQLVRRLDSLRRAPVVETYVGPVILENRAAGVFVHEVFGHRVEGHRQKAVDEGQTFVSKIGQRLAIPGVTVADDPTLADFRGQPLNGHYRFDDEGVPARPTLLLKDGIFRDFLFGRSVLSRKGSSNGHGRGVLGSWPVARMGNTVLSAGKGLPFPALRDSLRALLRTQGKPFGFALHDLSGGFTYTTRDLPQSYRLEPLYVTRIFADGRPDEAVRGVDAVGTPLHSLAQIAAVGDDPAVFNGHCGAESGWIPVSAVSPSLLLRSLELESRAKDQNLPPILPPPGRGR